MVAVFVFQLVAAPLSTATRLAVIEGPEEVERPPVGFGERAVAVLAEEPAAVREHLEVVRAPERVLGARGPSPAWRLLCG